MWRRRRTARMAASGLLALALAGCTGSSQSEQSAPSPSATPTGPQQSLHERAAPYDLALRAVAGGLPSKERKRYLSGITRPVKAWMDAGFVQGPWPRQRFRSAFTPFTNGVTGSARADADLLTLESEGSSLVDVIPERRWVRVSLTSPHDRAIGATARVDLRVTGLSQEGERSRYTVRGDLYLTRPDARGWQIFGYQLDRWVERGAQTSAGKTDGSTGGAG